MTVHFYLPALITIGSGLAGFTIGAPLMLTFDISDYLPVLGVILVYAGALTSVMGIGIQFSHWI